MSRLGIVTALMAEAVPIIDFYRLQKQPKKADFHYFTSDTIDLVVGGLASEKMSIGLNAYFKLDIPIRPSNWLNFGIAGAKDHPIGALVWATSIGGIRIDLPERAKNQQAMEVVSLSKPSSDYKSGCLFDMEASTFLDCIAKNVSEFENTGVFCAKVISDNARQKPHKIDKKWVTELIRRNINALDIEILKLIKS